MSLQNPPTKKLTPAQEQEIVEMAKAMNMTRNTKENRLTMEAQVTLVNLIAQCYSNAEIKQEMLERHGKMISTVLINAYGVRKKWKPIIKKLREEYEINIPQSKMFSKRSRLERIERIYDRAVTKDDIDNQLKAVTQGWKEIEGNKADGDSTNVYINNPVYNQLNLLSNEELLRRHKEATERLKLNKEL